MYLPIFILVYFYIIKALKQSNIRCRSIMAIFRSILSSFISWWPGIVDSNFIGRWRIRQSRLCFFVHTLSPQANLSVRLSELVVYICMYESLSL
jgi:hypothetical protein